MCELFLDLIVVSCLGDEVMRYPSTKSLHLSSCYSSVCSSVVRAFAYGAMGRRIDPSLYVLSCMWDDAYTISLVANRKE